MEEQQKLKPLQWLKDRFVIKPWALYLPAVLPLAEGKGSLLKKYKIVTLAKLSYVIKRELNKILIDYIKY